MAITEVVRLDIQTQQAQANMEGLSATINEQKLITIELERELKRLEQALRDTPKTAMAAQRDLNQQINHVKDSISDQRLSLKELQVQQSQTKGISKYTDKQKGLGDAMKITQQETTGLNMVTGGYASQLRNIQLLLGFAQKKALLFAGSLNVIKVALISTGIGALVVALGLIVAYWDEIKTAVTGVTEEMRNQLKISKDLIDSTQEEHDALVRNENVRRLAGETEEQILRTRIESNKKILEAKKLHLENQIAQKKASLETSKTLRGYANDIITFLSLPFSAILKAIDLANRAMGRATDHFGDFQKMVSGFIFDTDQQEKDLAEFTKKTGEEIDELNNKIAGDQISLNNIYTKANQKRIDDDAKMYNELRALREKYLEEQRSVQEQVDALANEYFEKFLSDQEREENAVQEKYFNLIEMAQQFGIDTNELEEARLFELESIQKNYDAQRLQAEQEKADAMMAMDELVKQQRIKTAMDTLHNVIAAVGQQSAVGKAAAVALATIETYQSAVSSYNSLSGIPIIGPALGAVAAGAAVAAGLANVKKILSVKVPGGGGGSGSGGSASTPRPPSFNMIGDRGGVSDVQSGIDNGEQAPPKAYVVGGDVTTQQELDRNAVNASGF